MYVSLQADVHHALGTQGLLEEIDLSQFPDLKSISDIYYDPYGLVTDVDAMVGAYNAEGDAPALETTSDFFDADKFPGTRAVAAAGSGEASGMCVLALIADGVPADKLVPIDIPRCLSVWDRVRDSVKQYWNTGTQSAGFMVSGAADYCLCYDGRMQQAKSIAPGVTYSLKGATLVPGWAGVPKNDKNKDIATDLMGSMIDPHREATFTQTIGYAAPNPESVNYLPESFKATLTTTPENAAELTALTVEQLTTLGGQSPEVNKAWDKWINNG
jgi:putative spermidine/putrescine transport system substrate-binding protein